LFQGNPRNGPHSSSLNNLKKLALGIFASLKLVSGLLAQASGPQVTANLEALAKAALAQHNGALTVVGLDHPVEVLRDRWGIPHIYAQDTHDLFFAQGFVAAQDHMWQMELWRRNGEGKLAEVLGPAYVERDEFARLLAFRGNWDVEFHKYHSEGPVIFEAFAAGVNEAIRVAREQDRIPIEFKLMGFEPEAVWTAKTVLTRMPAWNLSYNANAELTRALAVKVMGVERTQQVTVTDPVKPIVIPEGLDLNDITPRILDIARNANFVAWKFKPIMGSSSEAPAAQATGMEGMGLLADMDAAPEFPPNFNFDLGSNNWVVGGRKTATGMPILANDPHRDVRNPALRNLVHLVAPGWDDLGATEPGMPGITIGHNENVAWGFTILGVDQQDLYVEETDPSNPDRYLYKGEWFDMTLDRESIPVKGRQSGPVIFEAKTTRHGPVVYEDHIRHRAYALRWVGSEPGGTGYLGSLNVMQAKN